MNIVSDIVPPAAFRVLRAEGSAAEVGRAHGAAFGDEVLGSIGVYREKFERIGLAWDIALGYAQRSADALRNYDAALVEEMDGIATGAQVDPREVYVINVRTGLIRMIEERSEVDHECTTVAVTGAATADGHTLMGQNWDQNGACQPNTVLIEQRIAGQLALLYITEAGILFRHGMNEAGVGICGNALRTNIEAPADKGLPAHMLRRRALRHDNLAEASKTLVDTPRSHSGNHMMADAGGNAVDVESVPGDAFLVESDDGILVHSNHFQHPRAKEVLNDHGVEAHPDTLYRDGRVRDALRARHGNIGMQDVKLSLQDHHGHPVSVCRHPDPNSDTIGYTLVSTVMDLNDKRFLTAPGPACVGTYSEYGFS